MAEKAITLALRYHNCVNASGEVKRQLLTRCYVVHKPNERVV